MIYKCSQCGHDDFVRRLDDANWCANCLVAEVRRFRGTPSAEVAEMVKRLREGATVLDELFHRQAISDTMEEAAALLSKVGQGQGSAAINWTTEGCPKHHGQPWTFTATAYTEIGKRCPLCDPPSPERS